MQEEAAREAFSRGDATFMRNWRYAIELMQQRSEVKDKFRVVALVFADFLTSPEIEKEMVVRTGVASPLAATYEDPSIATPGIEVVRRALEQARPRPVTPAWPLISKAIYGNVHRALTGKVTARQALQAADREIDRALADAK
jgi:multiple sugar transport system substrate-binding protein